MLRTRNGGALSAPEATTASVWGDPLSKRRISGTEPDLFTPTAIPDVLIYTPRKHDDARGFFSEVYSAAALQQYGVESVFVQDNHSRSVLAGTMRGLHFQSGASAQGKLVRVLRGSIYDVAVDLRRSSPTFGRHVAVELSEENWRQVLIPRGFAHGFLTLVPNTEVMYKATALYSPFHDRGLAWNDPDLAIEWPIARSAVSMSDKDRHWPWLRDLPDVFP